VVAVPPLALALRAKRLSAYQNQQGISRKITNLLTGACGFEDGLRQHFTPIAADAFDLPELVDYARRINTNTGSRWTKSAR
jgi:hypothetical protein